jgi:hypothetical protein
MGDEKAKFVSAPPKGSFRAIGTRMGRCNIGETGLRPHIISLLETDSVPTAKCITGSTSILSESSCNPSIRGDIVSVPSPIETGAITAACLGVGDIENLAREPVSGAEQSGMGGESGESTTGCPTDVDTGG